MERYRRALEEITNTDWSEIDDSMSIISDIAQAALDGEPTTADRHNEDWLSQLLACPTCKVDLASIIEKYPNDMKLGNKIRTFANGVNNDTPK